MGRIQLGRTLAPREVELIVRFLHTLTPRIGPARVRQAAQP